MFFHSEKNPILKPFPEGQLELQSRGGEVEEFLCLQAGCRPLFCAGWCTGEVWPV